VGLCLVCLHPNNSDYQLIEVPFMEKELVDLFEYRREMLQAQAQKQKASAKALPKALPKTQASSAKALPKPNSKKGSGLLLNLNSI